MQQLIEQFGSHGEHPDFPCGHWLAAAVEGSTRQGYWEWVAVQLNMQGDPPKVWVVMSNDYPDSVFSTEEKAETYIAFQKQTTPSRIYWAAYDHIVDAKVTPPSGH